MPTKRISPSIPRAKAGPGATAALAEPAVTPLFQPVRTRRTFEAVASQIREQLARGELRPGDRLPAEKDLAEQFDVSRSAVREALRSLESAGVVDALTGLNGGFFIRNGKPTSLTQSVRDMVSLQQASIAHVTEARIELMAVAIRLACERATEEEIDAIEADIDYHTDLFRQGHGSRNTHSVIRFYQLIAEATHNEVFTAMVDALSEIIRGLLAQVDPRPRKDFMQVRRKVLTHLRARDASAAAAAMTAHLKLISDYLESESKKAATKRVAARRAA